MTTEFREDEYYKGRYLKSNRMTGIHIKYRSNNTIQADFFSVPGAMSYSMTVFPDEVTVEKDGVERLLFKSPSGKAVVVFADNRLYDDKYLKTHTIEEVVE